jgi:hypothetical protein
MLLTVTAERRSLSVPGISKGAGVETLATTVQPTEEAEENTNSAETPTDLSTKLKSCMWRNKMKKKPKEVKKLSTGKPKVGKTVLEPFRYYQVYGNVPQLPLGIIHKKSTDGEAHALQIANKVFVPKGMTDLRVVEREEPNFESKIKGGVIDFLYADSSVTELKWQGDKPILMIYPDARYKTGSRGAKGRGFCFANISVLETVLADLIRAHKHMKIMEENKAEKTKNAPPA